MNDKATYLYKIAELVVNACATQVNNDGKMSVTIDDVMGKSREENAVMTRCILVSLIIAEGYSVSTLAQLLNRTPHAIRNLIAKASDYQFSSRAYRIANAEATLAVEKLRELYNV